MDKKIKIAGVQMSCAGETEKNLSKAAMLVEIAAAEGASIVTLPQLFNSLWFMHSIDEANFELAESEDGPSVTAMREAALRNRCNVIAPIFEVYEGSYYSTAFVIGDDGELVGKYRKLHIPKLALWEEQAYFKPGDLGLPVFKLAQATIGVLVCWDIFFPEAWRVLALKGAEVVFAPTASAYEHSRKKWERAIRSAAHANGIFAMRVNRSGKEEKQDFYGGSFCAGPDGDYVVKPSGSLDGVVVAETNLADISIVRGEWSFLDGRMVEAYKGILENKK